MWFITLFAVLPFFAHTQDEHGEVVPGTPESAPYKINLLKIFFVNTIVAVVSFAGVYTVIANI
jgi:predicted secreted protein